MTHAPDAIYLTDVDYEYPEYPWWSGSTSEGSGGVKYIRADLAPDVAALVKALEWYADPERYRPHPHGIAFERPDISYVAVTALAAMKGGDT